MQIELIIPGKPIAKKRPRFARRGKFVKAYSDQGTEESRFLFELRQQYKAEPIAGPLTLHMVFDLPRPMSHYGTGKNAGSIKASAPKTHIQKPDLDNLVKFVKDCMNDCIYHDDCQVTREFSVKRWAEHGQTRVTVSTEFQNVVTLEMPN